MERVFVVIGCCLLVASSLPFAAAHLAQKGHLEGSPTSFGYGGPAVDPDPCRRESQPGVLDKKGGLDVYDRGTGNAHPVAPVQDLQGLPLATGTVCDSHNDNDKTTNWSHNGVSGTYVGAMTATVVECFASTADDTLDGSPTPDTKRDCDSAVWTAQTGQLASLEPLDFAMVGLTWCDFEFRSGSSGDDEEHIDNGHHEGVVPDGTWDDGGLGGACHISGYGPGVLGPPPDNANTDPSTQGSNDNNAETVCEGTVWAEDWMLGDDVPVLALCDSANFTSVGLLGHFTNLVNCVSPPIEPGCAQDEVDATIEDLLVGGDPGEVQECTPDQGGSTVDTVILGKGDGHNGNVGTGVSVPGVVPGCVSPGFGDVVVSVTYLMSANPFGHDVGTDCGAGGSGSSDLTVSEGNVYLDPDGMTDDPHNSNNGGSGGGPVLSGGSGNGAGDHDDGDGVNDRDWCSEDDFGWWLIGSSDDPDTPPCDGNTAFPYPATPGVEENPGPGLSPPESGECYDNKKDNTVVRGNHGRGDLIVYNPVAGWIDHFYDEDHSGDPGQDDLDGHHADCDPGPNGNKKASNC